MILFTRTRRECPELYQATENDVPVGEVHVRFGYISVICPGRGGQQIYKAVTRGDGRLEDYERASVLTTVAALIESWIRNGNLGPDYTVVEELTDGDV